MKQNHPDISQHTLLTPLERELMTSIEEWVKKLNMFNKEESKARNDTVSLLTQRLEALEKLHSAFQECQLAFISALIGWVDIPHSREKQKLLSEAITALRDLEKAASKK